MTTPSDAPVARPLPPAAVTARFLTALAPLTGARFDDSRAQDAVRTASRPGAGPMEVFTEAARALFMHADPEWTPLKDALWRSRNDTPVVLWSEPLGRWIAVTHAGWYRVRIADSESPDSPRTITRGELMAMLGVSGASETVEATVIDPEYHSAHIRGDEGGGHGAHGTEMPPHVRFFAFLRCERADITTFITYSIFASILYLGGPLAIDALVSGLAFGTHEQPYFQAIAVVAIAFGASLLLHGLISAFLHYISEIIQRRIFVRTAADLANRLPRADTASLDEVHTPELVNRFLDIATLQKSVAILLLDGVNIVLGGGFGMLLLALYHPYLMLYALVLGAIILLILRFFGNGGVETSIRESRIKYELVNCFEEIALYPFLFKGPGGLEFAARRANHLVNGYVSARDAHFRVLMRQVVGLIGLQVVAGAGLLVVGGYLVIRQEITLGQLVASEIIMSSIVSALGKLGQKLEAWYDAMAATDKLGHLVDLPVERSGGERPSEAARHADGAAVRAEGLGFAYNAGNPVFDGLSADIPAGARIALVGPHGAGSSTLLDMFFGLRQPTSGHIAVDGLDLRQWSLESLRSEAQLIRRNEIVEGTVIENLRLGRDDIGADEIARALDRIGLLGELRKRPEGLSLRLKVGGAPLSGTERTRLLLARAIVQRPRLLLLDELLDGLDDKAFAEVTPPIFDRSIPWTVVVTSRDPKLIARCDRVISLAAQPVQR